MFAIEDIEKFLTVIKTLNLPVYDDVYSGLIRLYSQEIVDEYMVKLELSHSDERLEELDEE